MKKIHFIFSAFILISLFLSFSCSTDRSGDEFTLTMVGFSNATAVFNLSRTHMLFGSHADTTGKSAIMAANGDLLFLMFEDESMFMRYNMSYGSGIEMNVDTVCNKRFYDQGDLVALYLTDDSLLMEWLESVDGQTFSHLRTLQVTLPLKERYRPHLQKIAEQCSGAGLVLECNADVTESDLKPLQALAPKWIYLTDYQLKIQDSAVSFMFREVELLGVEDEDIQWTLAPDLLPNLTFLILKNWDPLGTGNYSLPNAEYLQSLTLVEPAITNLSFLEQVPELKNFHVVSCDTLSDIEYLREIPSLNSLGFPYCSGVMNIQAMNHLHSLLWISYPTYTKQEEFAQIQTTFPELQVLELIGCEEISELAPITPMESLQCLIIDLPDMDLTPLSSMSNLRLLVIGEDEFEESADEISGIREALPGLQVFPGGGLCMGSGWILLLFPMLFIIRLFHQRKKLHKLKNR